MPAMPPIPKAELMRQLRARRRGERQADLQARTCAVCDKPIPPTARADRRTCSTTCRAKLSQRRQLMRVRLTYAERRAVFYAIYRWLREHPPGPALFVAEGVTFSVKPEWYGEELIFQAEDGDQRLGLRLQYSGKIWWGARTTRLEGLLWAEVRRLWLDPFDTVSKARLLSSRPASGEPRKKSCEVASSHPPSAAASSAAQAAASARTARSRSVPFKAARAERISCDVRALPRLAMKRVTTRSPGSSPVRMDAIAAR
jgi:predicted nucleic acid-binding Zn ribbon protein